jgi:hypothetical protein
LLLLLLKLTLLRRGLLFGGALRLGHVVRRGLEVRLG